MFILSQNEKITININNIIVFELIDTVINEKEEEIPSKDKFSIAVLTTAGNSFFIGTFKTREKAEKVIEDIRVWHQRREDVIYSSYQRATSTSNTFRIPKEEE